MFYDITFAYCWVDDPVRSNAPSRESMSMPVIIRPVIALLLSAAIVLMANGLDGVLLPLRGAIEGFSQIEIGLIGSAYYTGLTLGCLLGPRVIMRVGHIRAFAVFTAVATISPLLEAMWPSPVSWWIFRGLTGICFAGIMNAVESWLSGIASNENRGTLLSTYAIINFSAIMLGQQLINLADTAGFELFSLCAILISLAAVPLALTRTPHPTDPALPQLQIVHLYKVSPAAVAGCLGAGLANGAFWSLAPLYARDTLMPEFLIAIFVSLAVAGGAIAQWPIGRLSDRIDRRRVLGSICLGAALAGILLSLAVGWPVWLRLGFVALFGVFTLPVYWVSVAHANDLAKPEDMVNVSSSLLLLFGVGAIVGPVFGASLMSLMGPGALFLYTAIIHMAVTAMVLYRTTQRAALPPAERTPYEELPKSTTPAVYEAISPDGAQEEAKPQNAAPSH